MRWPTFGESALGGVHGQIAFTSGLDTMNRIARRDDRSTQLVPIKRLDNIPDAKAPTLSSWISKALRNRCSPAPLAYLGHPLCSPCSRSSAARWFETLL